MPDVRPTLHMRVVTLLAFFHVAMMSFNSRAEPLPFDGWQSNQVDTFRKWLHVSANAASPCDEVQLVPPKALAGIIIVGTDCKVISEGQKPVRRVRTLKLSLTAASWQGHRITQLEYTQEYSFDAKLVYYAKLSQQIEASY